MKSEDSVRTLRLGRRVAGPVLLAALLGAVAPVTANAANPIVLDNCNAVAQGTPGQQVALQPAAVLQPITDTLAPLDPLGILRPQLAATWSALPPIPIGAVSSVAGLIAGNTIGDAVVAQLGTVPVVSPVLSLLTGQLRATLTQFCGVATSPVTPPGQPAPPPPAPKPQPGTPTTGATPPGAQAPAPGTQQQSPGAGPQQQAPAGAGAVPGGATAAGSGVAPEQVVPYYAGSPSINLGPGVSPEGVVRLNDKPPPQYGLVGGAQQPQGLGVPTIGDAERLNAAASSRIGSPTLLFAFAGLLLACVGAQLARSWAMRSAKETDQATSE